MVQNSLDNSLKTGVLTFILQDEVYDIDTKEIREIIAYTKNPLKSQKHRNF